MFYSKWLPPFICLLKAPLWRDPCVLQWIWTCFYAFLQVLQWREALPEPRSAKCCQFPWSHRLQLQCLARSSPRLPAWREQQHMLLCAAASEVSRELKINKENQIKEPKGWSLECWLLNRCNSQAVTSEESPRIPGTAAVIGFSKLAPAICWWSSSMMWQSITAVILS